MSTRTTSSLGMHATNAATYAHTHICDTWKASDHASCTHKSNSSARLANRNSGGVCVAVHGHTHTQVVTHKSPTAVRPTTSVHRMYSCHMYASFLKACAGSVKMIAKERTHGRVCCDTSATPAAELLMLKQGWREGGRYIPASQHVNQVAGSTCT